MEQFFNEIETKEGMKTRLYESIRQIGCIVNEENVAVIRDTIHTLSMCIDMIDYEK